MSLAIPEPIAKSIRQQSLLKGENDYMPNLQPLTENERAMFPGFTHSFTVDVKNGDVTQSTTNTAQTWNVYTETIGDRIRHVAAICTEKLANSADAAFNSSALTVGEADDEDNFIASQELNTNGSAVQFGYDTGDALPLTVASSKVIHVVLNSMSGKALSNLNKGKFVVLFDIFSPSPVLGLRPQTP